jgi:5-methyltetrahydrofolate--homocysteine methyltransferase
MGDNVRVRSSLADLLALGAPLLADGATGTNYFQMGLTSGEPPEFWNIDHPERVQGLYRRFIDAGSDIILTNSFGGTAQRLKLHKAEGRVRELAMLAGQLAREVADAAERPVVVAGSVGPTGELFAPLGALTPEIAIASFQEQIEGLRDGGVDVIWIETMSAIDEVRAAAQAAINAGMPYTATVSFDTAGRTMMGLLPKDLVGVFDGLSEQPLGMGSNCGVGASDILVSLLHMHDHGHPELDPTFILKGNCGIPKFVGTEAVYTGTPELMADYARLAIAAGAKIIGGCCGTSPDHLAAMRSAIDAYVARERPTMEEIIDTIGPMVNALPGAATSTRVRSRRRGSEDE